MSTFIVSLFLPYTVDFQELPAPARRQTPPPRSAEPKAESPVVDIAELRHHSLHDRKSSIDASRLRSTLLTHPTPPRTPSSAHERDEYFNQLQLNSATHFVTPTDPRSLVRSDSHMPEWGSSRLFNQPAARPGEMPPARILGYGPSANGEVEGMEHRTRTMSPGAASPTKSHRRHHSRSVSREHKWASQWSIVPSQQGNGGLTNAVRAANETGALGDIIWMGTVGFPTDAVPEQTKDEITEKMESEFDALPVYVKDADFDGHYSHFCKTILWPVFHYQIPDHPKSKAYEDHSYKYYERLNQAFADRIVANYKRDDVIWIHDYHLLLVPAMVRSKLPDAKIGFFLHTAFPSSEVFRCLAMRVKLLEGMMGANMIGFQCEEYLTHFLTTSSRLLRVPVTQDGVEMDDHFVDVTALDIGIDPKRLDSAREEPEFLDWMKQTQERFKGKHLIVACDRLDQVHGVRQKLLAFELFLNNNPDWVEKVVLVQIATPATEQEQLASTVSDIVTRIDATHSTLAHQPLVFLRQDISLLSFYALLSEADVLMVTSLREGMSLIGHDFTVCQDGKYSIKKHAPMILSEFTGAASVFDNKPELTINPWDYKKTANALKTALEMDDKEKDVVYERIRNIVFTHTGEYWMKELVNRLNAAYEARYQRDTRSTPRLSFKALQEKYSQYRERLFIMDYEGTLATFTQTSHVHLNSPQRVEDALVDLIQAGNTVYVMSGRMPEELDNTFSRVKGLGLIAENGCFVRPHGRPRGEWKAFVDTEAMSAWKRDVKNTLDYYQDRMEGSVLEEKHCSLVLRYDGVKEEDQEAAARLAGDCANHINDACAKLRIRAVHGEKALVMEPIDYGKGKAAEAVFGDVCKGTQGEGIGLTFGSRSPDFLFVAGDDREDEAVFKWANSLEKGGSVKSVTTVSVGKKNTEAMATLTQGTSGLLSVLQKLTGSRR